MLDQKSSQPSTARKRDGSSSDTEDTELYSMSEDDSSDDSFIPVLSKRAKRKIVEDSPSSSPSTGTMKSLYSEKPPIIAQQATPISSL
ncbi:hypothetical protein HPB50_016212 [Hyalomma asiaticum]|uniref:Uncharacterized protein n=1 Tax=Hyalomma asiaticum TaxID=266040 RepID=A0ACB7RTY8_HYAAI|nr:hypothetical protein HPB50_016212 [Hyalomma asiaticum]